MNRYLPLIILYVIVIVAIVLLNIFKAISFKILIVFILATLSMTILVIFYVQWLNIKQEDEKLDKKIKVLEAKAEEHPEKTRYVWDVARIKLEAYFDANLSQINSIYWISIFVIVAGFVFVIYGINVRSDEEPSIPYVASVAGILTEFIGATFMVIYRSAIKQASTYMSTLDRINSVGMAIEIIDSISEDKVDLKNETKAELVKLLLKNGDKT